MVRSCTLVVTSVVSCCTLVVTSVVRSCRVEDVVDCGANLRMQGCHLRAVRARQDVSVDRPQGQAVVDGVSETAGRFNKVSLCLPSKATHVASLTRFI